MTGLIYQNVLLKESDNQNNNISDNNSEVNNDNINNNTIIVDDSFHCVLDQQSNNSATSLNYKKEK